MPSPSPRNGNMTLSAHLKVFTFYELYIATRYFCSDAVLGESGFGYIYKGWINEETLSPAEPGESRMPVAIKALNPIGLQGDKEWLTEVNYLAQLDHPNLVNIIGFCCEGENSLLVSEFMSQGSLENRLFSHAEQPLSWELRMKLAVEAARGLSFLHDSASRVIYRGFKSSKILLDMDYNVKLSDFGFAKAGPIGDETQLYFTTQVMETEGYTAPEYIASGRLAKPCDVYSFGIVLLELITGRRAIDNKRCSVERNLLNWVTSQLIEPKKIHRIMDVKLEGRYSRKQAFIVASLACDCCRLDAMRRPFMSDVLFILEKLLLSTNAKHQSEMSRINGDGPSRC
ncbi:putative serine/threonine-protein kinase PBL3 [Bidens hawaiensis]|uniref:putative serine/threonine-protein kinase PBL3 n=1 Tax=Bidens hawaiensis TaxID=980011 RepID=UPI00404B1337